MIVGVLTICRTQYTWDRSTCTFYLIEQHSKVFVTCLRGALNVHSLWFYKHQHENRVRSKLFVACQYVAFSLPFAAILVNCAPSGEMHNYRTVHHKRKLRISWSIGASIYSYLKCIVYDELLKPRQSFWITLYILLSLASSFLYISRYKSLRVSYSCIILLLEFESLQHCCHWLFVTVTKRGFSYRPTSDTAACISRTTFPQVITLKWWDILYNEEFDGLFLRTSLSIGGVVTCAWDTETRNAFRLHVSKSIWKRVFGRLTSAG